MTEWMTLVSMIVRSNNWDTYTVQMASFWPCRSCRLHIPSPFAA